MIKNMDKRSKIILLSLIGIPVFIILLLIILKSCSSGKSAYSTYENKMVKSAEKYFTNKNKFPIMEGGTVQVSLDDLVKEEYIKSPDKELNDSNCSGYVTVQANGISVDDTNINYLYIPHLSCDNYKTVHLIDKLKEQIVTEKSGLYETGDGYVYKGAKTNNYLSFYGKKYLIISIDSNNVLKLVKIDAEKEKVVWDDKFNPEINNAYGKNDYSDSYILDYLQGLYLETDSNKKKHLIAYSVCYGNRLYDDDSVSKSAECSKKLDNQFISLLNTYDYAMASYDPDCNSIYSGSCSNYNYLFNNLFSTSWLMNGTQDNSYEVYYYSYGIWYSRASKSNKFNMVIYLNGNELYTRGDGSFSDPYIIED